MGATARILARSFRPAPFDQEEGEVVRLAGSFADLPPLGTTAFTLLRSQLAGIADFVNPRAELGTMIVEFVPARRFPEVAAPAILQFFVNPGETDSVLASSFANPFSSEWPLYARATVRYEVPLTFTTEGITVTHEHAVPVERLSAVPLPTTVSLVSGPRVNGLDAWIEQDGIGLTPSLAWDPPNDDGGDAYFVRVWRIAPRELVATFSTRGTLLHMPPTTIETDSAYVFQIEATRTTADAYQRASIVTAVLRP
jgi:hypothetical protein